MTSQLFTPGQEVVCVEADWIIVYPVRTRPTYATPEQNEIYHVDQYHTKLINGKWYLSLRQFGIDMWFNQDHFAPMMPHDQLESELLEIFQPITII